MDATKHVFAAVKPFSGLLALGLAVGLLLAVSPALAVQIITDSDIVATDNNTVGSGNGTLDFLFFTESAGGSGNSSGGFDGDNANTDMPTGAGSTAAVESFITSIDELRDFYILNFPDGGGGSLIQELVVFVDLNQIGGSAPLGLNAFTTVKDYTASFGDDRDNPAGTDISSALQNMTNSGFAGGTVLAQLDGPKTLPLNEQGAGFADYAIFTGIDPFDPALDGARLLFFWDSGTVQGPHNDGGESIFLSGQFGAIPEPGTMALMGFGGLLLLVTRRRR